MPGGDWDWFFNVLEEADASAGRIGTADQGIMIPLLNRLPNIAP
jgi:hypothetical protein